MENCFMLGVIDAWNLMVLWVRRAENCRVSYVMFVLNCVCLCAANNTVSTCLDHICHNQHRFFSYVSIAMFHYSFVNTHMQLCCNTTCTWTSCFISWHCCLQAIFVHTMFGLIRLKIESCNCARVAIVTLEDKQQKARSPADLFPRPFRIKDALKASLERKTDIFPGADCCNIWPRTHTAVIFDIFVAAKVGVASS